jgi:hypothetical protein
VIAAHDPRPDLVDDAPAWLELLERAAAIDGDDGAGVYWALLGARAIGAELVRTGTGIRLRSRETGQDPEYVAVRPHLQRNLEALTGLLRGAG